MRKFALLLAMAFLASCQATGDGVNLEAKKAMLKRIAETEKDKGNVQSAAQLEAQIVSLDNKDPDSFLALISSFENMGEKEAALETAEVGAKLNPDNLQLKLAAAKAYIANDKPEKALETLTAMKDFRTVEYYNFLGVANDMINNSLAAQDAYRQALELSPSNLMTLNNQGLSYLLAGETEKAVPIFENLYKRADATATVRSNLALAYGLSKKDAAAKQVLLKDLSRKQADENMKYYRELRKKK